MSDPRWFPAANEPAVVGRFVTQQELDIPKSREMDEKVYREIIVLETKVEGAHDVSVIQLKSGNRKSLLTRFPQAWQAFEGVPVKIEGTPLDAIGLTADQIDALKLEGVYVVEQVARMSDAIVQRLGFGWRKIRTTAKAHLSADAKAAARPVRRSA